jgi:hypothetical protein
MILKYLALVWVSKGIFLVEQTRVCLGDFSETIHCYTQLSLCLWDVLCIDISNKRDMIW